MNKKKFVIITLLIMLVVSLYFPFLSFPETIILKSGKKIEGRIIEKTNKYIKIDFAGVLLTYYSEEIDSIKEEPQEAKLSSYSEYLNETKSLPMASATKKNFRNEEWRYSFEYPLNWETIPKEDRKEGHAMGFRTKDRNVASEPYVTIGIQRGNLTEGEISGKSTLAELVDTLLIVPSELEQEFAKSITLGNESGYLKRCILKSAAVLTNVDGAEGTITIPYKHIFEYYFFSPAFSSQGRDMRFFLIEFNYMEWDKARSEIDSINNVKVVGDFNSAYENENKNTEKLTEEAREVINSFRFTGQ